MTLAMLPKCTYVMATGPVGYFSAPISTKSMLTIDMLASRMWFCGQVLGLSIQCGGSARAAARSG